MQSEKQQCSGYWLHQMRGTGDGCTVKGGFMAFADTSLRVIQAAQQEGADSWQSAFVSRDVTRDHRLGTLNNVNFFSPCSVDQKSEIQVWAVLASSMSREGPSCLLPPLEAATIHSLAHGCVTPGSGSTISRLYSHCVFMSISPLFITLWVTGLGSSLRIWSWFCLQKLFSNKGTVWKFKSFQETHSSYGRWRTTEKIWKEGRSWT